jgi:hypothetical protein
MPSLQSLNLKQAKHFIHWSSSLSKQPAIITQECLKNMATLKHLQTLDLEECEIKGDAFQHLANIKNPQTSQFKTL